VVRACRTHGKRRNAYRILVGNPEGKRLLRIRRRKVRIILGQMFEKQDVVVLNLSGSG
jgi:hypothetical protein